MEDLIASFDKVGIPGGVQQFKGRHRVYLSEISSPTRLWFQEADNMQLDQLMDAME